jgi:diacylglycerol kinase (ATP)
LPVAVFANPRSGSGRAARLAEDAESALRAAGHTVSRFDVGPGLPPIDLAAAVAGATVAVAAGGDGTVRSLAPACIGADVPIYHLPSGNENLFAREFGMDRDPETLVRALRRYRVTSCDVGTCKHEQGGEAADNLFLLMASIGPDAGVCHRLDATRTRGIGHRAYFGPIYAEFQEPAITRLRIWCDGQGGEGAAVAEGRGMVVVANCRQYGMRIDPCHRASTTDGLFDVAFIPADTAVDAFVALARLRFRMPAPDIVRATGSRVRIDMGAGAKVQLDGEAEGLGRPSPPHQVVEFSMRHRVLPVLDAR